MPRLVHTLLSTTSSNPNSAYTNSPSITSLETYLSRTLALLLLAFAALNLLLTGLIPTADSWKTVRFSPDTKNGGAGKDGSKGLEKNPYAVPTVIVTTIYHAITSFYLYANITYGLNFALVIGLACSGTLFCVGMWVLLFGSEKGRISKKTGADRRTGNFPFTNVESAREIKKESKREEKERAREEKERRKAEKEERGSATGSEKEERKREKEKDREEKERKRRTLSRGSSWR